MTNTQSQLLYERAVELMPGGVNSPVRAFRSVGGQPLFISHANGSRIFDVDGNSYIDYVGSWGPMILGHNHPAVLQAVVDAAPHGLSFGAPTEAEILLSEKMIDLAPGIEMVRMVNSGTEAVMSALRLARAFTNRDKVIKFTGCYHGHTDSMLVKAGSGLMTAGQPDSPGVPSAVAKDTLLAEYNDLTAVENLLDQYDVAAVIVEPVAANMGVVCPNPDFLQGLRELCDSYGTLLIFDEVITGFRLAPGGAQEYYAVLADIVTYGKIIGGGMPVGAYAARREIMELVAPSGQVYQAGTLSGNPIAMAAGLAQLKALEDGSVHRQLNQTGKMLLDGLSMIVKQLEQPACVTGVGSLICGFFGIETAFDYSTVRQADTGLYARFFQGMLASGIYLAPSQFEAMFVSAAHSIEDIEETLEAARIVLNSLV